MTDTLECDDVIYHHHYFAFDPEDVRRNNGFFYRLLQFTTGTVVTNADGQEVEIVTTNLSAILDPVFWSVLVIVVTLALLSITCCCQCCVACFCRGGKSKKKSILYKICCGSLSWLLAALILAGAITILWSEVTMDAGVVSHRNSTFEFAKGVLPDASFVSIVNLQLQFFYSYQLYRHWVSFGMAIITIIIMLVVMLAICFCAPVKKSMDPIVTMLIINGIWTFGVSLMAAVTFYSLFFMSYLCYDLYRIGGNTRCTDQSLLQHSLSLQQFCSGDVYIPHLIAVGVYFFLLFVMVIWQIVGSWYAGVYSGRNLEKAAVQEPVHDENEEASEQHEMVTTTTTHVEYIQPVNRPASPPYAPAPGMPLFFIPSPNTFQPQYQPAQPMHVGHPAPPKYEDC